MGTGPAFFISFYPPTNDLLEQLIVGEKEKKIMRVKVNFGENLVKIDDHLSAFNCSRVW